MNYQLRSLVAAAWTFLQMLFERLSQTIVFLVVATVLGPADFGIATLAVAPSLIAICLTPAASDAIVQRVNITPVFAATGFWVTVLAGLVGAAVIWALAPVMAYLTESPEIIGLMRVSALAPLASAIGAVPEGMLARRFDFRLLAIRKALGVTIAGAICIGMAFLGFGAWSVVMQTVSFSIVASVVSIAGAKWRPGFALSRDDAASFSGAAGAIMANLALEVANNRAPEVLGGIVAGPEAAGFLKLAKSILDAVVSVLFHPVLFVLLPLFSKMREDDVSVERTFAEIMSMSALLFCLPMIWMALLSPGFVAVVLGRNWAPIVPVLIAYAFVFPALAVTAPLRPYLIASGHIWFLIAAQAAQLAIGGVLLYIAAHFGPLMVALAYLATCWLYAAFYLTIGLFLGRASRQQLGVYVLPGLAVLLTGLAIYGLGHIPGLGGLWQEIATALVLTLVYLGLVLGLRRAAFAPLLGMLPLRAPMRERLLRLGLVAPLPEA